MEFPLILIVIIFGFIMTLRQKTDDWNDVYTDFNEMLRESSEMCDAAIQSVLEIVSRETNEKTRTSEYLKFFGKDCPPINASKSVNEKETCEARSLKDVEEICTYNNWGECLKMIEIEEDLEGVFEEMLESSKEISSIKEEFPDIIEANCSGEEDGETCKLQLLHSVKSHVADLLTQASFNLKIINEIIRVYRKNAVVCFDKILA